jgi:hypothetical protein
MLAGAINGGGVTQSPTELDAGIPGPPGASGQAAPSVATSPSRNVPPADGSHTVDCCANSVNAGTLAEQVPLGVAMLQQATRSMVQFDAQNSSPSHHSPGSMTPFPQTAASVVVVLVVVVDVVLVAQPEPAHASQQLAYWAWHPPRARQRSAVVMRQAAPPSRRGRQHATRSGRPHVERAAHLRTARPQSADSTASAFSRRISPATQARYSRRVAASH